MDKIQPLLLHAVVAAFNESKKDESDKKLNTALTLSHGLPLLLRRHGLLATTAHLYNSNDEPKAESPERWLATKFINALHSVAPFQETAGVAEARIRELSTEGLDRYLLHSRMALALADAWVRLAESMLPDAGDAKAAKLVGRAETEIANAAR